MLRPKLLYVEGEIIVDDSEFPLVVTRFPRVLTNDAVNVYIERMTQVAARGRFSLVADTRGLSLGKLDRGVRARFFELAAEWDAGPGFERKISEAIVLEGWLARAVAAAYVWQVRPEHFVLRLMSSLDEAREWSLQKLAEEGLRKAG